MVEEGDDLIAVIRGHLWIDFLLNAALEAALDHPEEAVLDRLPFPTRVDLAVALGVLARELGETCVAANRVRNRFAHDLDFELDDEVAAVLRASS
jgi:hypothetical protein